LSSLSLNHSQIQAIERSVSCKSYHLVWGPPGTGKTRIIPEIIRRVTGRLLLGAFTNTAVDKMLIALLGRKGLKIQFDSLSDIGDGFFESIPLRLTPL